MIKIALVLCSFLLISGCKKEEPVDLINPAEGLTNRFFYAYDKKIPLLEKPVALTVKFFEDIDSARKAELFTGLLSVDNIKWHNPMVAEINCNDEFAKKEMMAILFARNEVKVCVPFYTDTLGADMGYTDDILIAFHQGVSSTEQERLHKKYGTVVAKTTKIYQKLVVSKGVDALEVANRYYESGLLKFAQPNFLSSPEVFMPAQ